MTYYRILKLKFVPHTIRDAGQIRLAATGIDLKLDALAGGSLASGGAKH